MSLLQELGTGQGYLKAGFLGFPKSGKTYTATDLAIGLAKYFSLTGAIAMYDTEGGAEYVAPRIKTAGFKFVGVRSRTLADLINMGKECVETGVAVLIVDSVTHPWREVCDSYLAQVNKKRAAKGKPLQTKLEFQDWAPIKAKWAAWTDFYLNSALHIIICGRAGFEFDMIDREDGPGKDLVKTGIKMKTESEFGFEPSLLVQMERVQVRDDDNRLTGVFEHRARVLGDRFGVIDAAQCDNPTFDFFLPHIQMLVPNATAPIDTTSQTDLGVDDEGADEYHRSQRERIILTEEIQGELTRVYPGQTKEEKTGKMNLIEGAFNTRSWTKVEGMNAKKLREGLACIREQIANIKPVAGGEND